MPLRRLVVLAALAGAVLAFLGALLRPRPRPAPASPAAGGQLDLEPAVAVTPGPAA